MRHKTFRNLTSAFGAAVLFFVLSADIFGQGRGRGNSGNSGRGNSGSSTGMGRGNTDMRGGGRSNDDMRGARRDDRGRTADRRADGRRGNGANNGDNINRYTGLSKRTGVSREKLQSWYQTERELNPDLTFGQFVAANMIATNRGTRHPQLTTEAILGGLRDGDSLGKTLKSLGLRGDDYDREKRRIKDEVGKYRRRGDYDDDDFDLDW